MVDSADPVQIVSGLALLGWGYLLAFRRGFWRADQQLERRGVEPVRSDATVTAVIPARNEADVVGPAVLSLLTQDHAPALNVVLVDDGSSDGTAEIARRAARSCGADDRLDVVSAGPRPVGWAGKTWAMAEGVRAAAQWRPRYLLLCDADVAHGPGMVHLLVAKAEAEQRDLVSLMVRLHCATTIERLLIPAFVFFFQKLYPFRAVNDPGARTAAAAGGCILVRAGALERAGGIDAIRGALIDDCALARRIKAGGSIWLGLSERTVSLRPYDGLADIWRMVARSAYAQLCYSPLNLIAAVLGMALIYLAAPVAFVLGIAFEWWLIAALGAVTWMLMALAYAPTLRRYELSALWGFTLPLAALLYMLMTVDSVRRHWRGRGGEWKGRLNGGVTPEPSRSSALDIRQRARPDGLRQSPTPNGAP